MKQKIYEKPTMQIVKLKQQQKLLQSSGDAGVQDYTWHEEIQED